MTSPFRPTPPWQRLLIVGAVVAGIVALFVVNALKGSSPSTDQASSDTPAAVATTPDVATPDTMLPIAPDPTPSPTFAVNSSCDQVASWAQDGNDSAMDGLINNQNDTEDLKPDELKAGCPQYYAMWQKAQGGIGNGESFAVPGEVKPGLYETVSSDLEGCYWERSRNGHIVANNFITASSVKQRVTIRSTDDTFVSRGCGDWVKVS